MGGALPAIARFQDSDFFQIVIEKSIEMPFECEFAPFGIQTVTLSHPWRCFLVLPGYLTYFPQLLTVVECVVLQLSSSLF